MSSSASICFGALVNCEQELPWGKEEDIEDWWMYEVQGYRNPYSLFTEDGKWIDGEKPEQDVIDYYYTCRKEFLEANPTPVVVVFYGTKEEKLVLLSIPESVRMAWSDIEPVEIHPRDMTHGTFYWSKKILDFCSVYGVELLDRPRWILSSYGD